MGNSPTVWRIHRSDQFSQSPSSRLFSYPTKLRMRGKTIAEVTADPQNPSSEDSRLSRASALLPRPFSNLRQLHNRRKSIYCSEFWIHQHSYRLRDFPEVGRSFYRLEPLFPEDSSEVLSRNRVDLSGLLIDHHSIIVASHFWRNEAIGNIP